MSILGRTEILERISKGEIYCNPASPKIGTISMDLTLGDCFFRIDPNNYGLFSPENYGSAGDFIVLRHGVTLCHTHEYVGTTVPHLAMQLNTVSTIARHGISTNMGSMWIEPGYCSRITLEMYNPWKDPFYLPVGTTVCSVVFHTVQGCDSLCDSSYNVGEKEWTPWDMLPKVNLGKWSKEKVKGSGN